MQEILLNLAYLLNRYCHVVAMTLLVGGTLFYETVVPLAIGELKTEQQLAIFARARWVFRWIVFSCATVLLVSGALSTYRDWPAYSGHEAVVLGTIMPRGTMIDANGEPELTLFEKPRTWFVLHAALGLASIVIAVGLVLGDRPPNRPVRWMRVNLVLLLLAIFLASASRNARLRLLEGISAEPQASGHRD